MASSLVDFLHAYKVRCIDELESPVLLVDVEGTAGTTSYTYKASYVTLVGESLPSETVVVTTGNSTLSANNKIKLYTSNIPESVTYIRYWKYVSGSWVKLGDVARSVAVLYDTGQTTIAATLPTVNTSGRKGVIAICPLPGTMNQRMNWLDLQAILFRKEQRLWDGIHRNGDVISGCLEHQDRGSLREDSHAYLVDDIIYVDAYSPFTYICTTPGTSASSDPGSWPVTIETTKTDGDAVFTCICNYNFTDGEIYLFGAILDIPSGEVELTGSGTEVVGLTIAPIKTTSDDDVVQRASFDEGVIPLYSNAGPDWLYLETAWKVDEPGQVTIKEFLDGVPKQATLATQRTSLEIELARQRFDTSGDFVVNKFPIQVKEHADDDTKLMLVIGRGKAYPNGFEVQFDGTRLIEFDKARETKAVNNSGIDSFDIPGGRVTSSNAEGTGFDLNGLALKFKVGSGNYHTVTFTADDMTAAQVAAFIESEVNTYGAEDLLNCVAASGYIQIQAPAGKTLEIAAVASDCYTVLGLSTGTEQPIGSRIYEVNDNYVKEVTDISYKIRKVTSVTHNGTTHKDLLGENCVNILGASITVGDCNDTKYDYEEAVDWQKDGNYIDFTLGGDDPANGATYYVDWEQNYNPTIASRVLVEVIDATVVKGAEDGLDNIVYTGATSIKEVSNGDAVSLSGSASDVVEILRINNSSGQSATQYTSYSLLKNSGALIHETSQIDWSDAGAQGVNVTGQPTTGATYYVSYRVWQHAVEGDVVVADSYDSYEDIEVYADVALRDCLDFRTSGGVRPEDGEDATIDYEFYLSRIDKLVIDDQANLRLVTGAAAVSPIAPSDQLGVQSLAVVMIPPYTYLPSHVTPISLEVLRLTQRQLQNVADRVTRLEYWSAVNELEKEANNQAIYGALGGTTIAAEKQGIFTDALTGFGRCDLQYDKEGVTFSAAIDTVKRQVRLAATQEIVVIEVDDANCVNIRHTDNSVMLDYQAEVIEEQPYAGITVNGAYDFVVTNYYGHLAISPQTDIFVDSEQLPTVNIDFDNNFSGLVSGINAALANCTNWGSWSNGAPHVYNAVSPVVPGAGMAFSTYSGYVAMPSEATITSTTRTGQQAQLIPGSVTQELGSSVVDLSLQGKMRAGVEISCDVKNLLPNVDHAVAFNGVICDFTYDSSPVNHAGEQGTNSYSGKTTVKTSNDGCLTGTFEVPEGVPIGSAEVRVFYYADPAISVASAVYYTAGFTTKTEATTIGLPTANAVFNTTIETGLISNTQWNIASLTITC